MLDITKNDSDETMVILVQFAVNCVIFIGCIIYILKTWDWVKSE